MPCKRGSGGDGGGQVGKIGMGTTVTLGGLMGSVWFSSECIFSPHSSPESPPWLLPSGELCVGLNEALESSRVGANRTGVLRTKDKGVFSDVRTVMARAGSHPAAGSQG